MFDRLQIAVVSTTLLVGVIILTPPLKGLALIDKIQDKAINKFFNG